ASGRDLERQFCVATGDLSGAGEHGSEALRLFSLIGDRKDVLNCGSSLLYVLLDLGRLADFDQFFSEMATDLEIVNADPPRIAGSKLVVRRISGIAALMRKEVDRAINTFHSVCQAARPLNTGWLSGIIFSTQTALGHALLYAGKRDEAATCFRELLDTASGRSAHVALSALAGLAGAVDNDEFNSFCSSFRDDHLEFIQFRPRLSQEPVVRVVFPRLAVHDEFSGALDPKWQWIDPFGDCSFHPEDGLALRAAAGRNLSELNRSAPRLMREAPQDFAAQVVCGPALPDRPAIGGLLLWQSPTEYIRLARGSFGAFELTFSGHIGNEERFYGRGRLESESVFLRLERVGGQVKGLCSSDGESWFLLGEMEFPPGDADEVGMFAVGVIDHCIYPGIFPDGAAIRFGDFLVFEGSEKLSLSRA
ncbi:MAG: hypothetical protein LC772_02295, partial [Chloroflexi bacterium]|nr:hypothetical protein [Chloroflexota bacterium]